jgi:hypothetical protein
MSLPRTVADVIAQRTPSRRLGVAAPWAEKEEVRFDLCRVWPCIVPADPPQQCEAHDFVHQALHGCGIQASPRIARPGSGLQAHDSRRPP